MARVFPSTIHFLSHIISNVMNPLFSFLLFFVYYSYLKMEKLAALQNLLWLIVIVVLPIYTWIYWNVKTGRYSNMDVSDRKQRYGLYLFNFSVMAVYIAVLYYTKQQSSFIETILYIFFLMFLMNFSNFFIKSSLHTAFNVFVSTLFYTLNPVFGGIWLLLTVLLGASRIVLKRHTLKEVMVGAFIAGSVSWIYLKYHS